MAEQPAAYVFEPVREWVEIDLDALLLTIPAEITVKRMVVDFALTRLAGQLEPAAALSAAGVEFAQRGPFDEVLWHDYFRVMVFIAETTHGRERLSVGLREIGARFYPGVMQTPLGKLMLGRYLGEAVRNAATAWQELNTLGRVWSEFTNEREFLYHFEQFPSVLAESVAVGIFEGLFRYHHMPATIEIARLGPQHAVLRVGW